MQEYFTPGLVARILEGRSASERERIEGWVAYTRQAPGLRNPAGFLRTKIEGAETAPPTGGACPELKPSPRSLQSLP